MKRVPNTREIPEKLKSNADSVFSYFLDDYEKVEETFTLEEGQIFYERQGLAIGAGILVATMIPIVGPLTYVMMLDFGVRTAMSYVLKDDESDVLDRRCGVVNFLKEFYIEYQEDKKSEKD